MRKKKIYLFSLGILGILCLFTARAYYKQNLVEKNKKMEVSKTVLEYLMSKDNFRNEVFEETEVKYDRDLKMYIVSVTFENNPKKAVVMVSNNNEINE